ncbi:NADPH-dependent FMN reductase [Thalassotalea marina]|uniref:FMN reductase n=1 Tax=Thalassotalea marina TaxID=1673741 RepID=A0A919EGX6_9GAMM|nr:NAD(P)H-dependent oxidoreductase [Thalassotalea marina]GHF78482.1 FMN reductase [Thalassotalea marina]
MKILAFGATSSSKSINKQLAVYAANLVPQADVDVLDLNEFEMPLFSQDKEEAIGHPQLAKDFLARIEQADAIIISFAEHNGSYTVAYKNVFDWASRINTKVFQNKPMIMLATSPGPGGAASVLASAVNSAPYFDGEVKGSLSVPSFYDNFNSDEAKLVNQELNQELAAIVSKLTS